MRITNSKGEVRPWRGGLSDDAVREIRENGIGQDGLMKSVRKFGISPNYARDIARRYKKKDVPDRPQK